MSRPAAGLRLLALPLAQRKAATAPDLIYFHPLFPPRSTQAPSDDAPKPSLPVRAINKASEKWESWGKMDGGWQRKLYTYGEKAMDRIAYEEWALKSLDPSLAPKPWSEAAAESLPDGSSASKPPAVTPSDPPRQGTVPLLFPSSLISRDALSAHLTEQVEHRAAYHQKWLVYDVLGIPLTAPFMIVPVVPNIPFFFLAWRAYSHWKARNASRYLSSLVSSRQLLYDPSKPLDDLYAAAKTEDVEGGRLLLDEAQVDGLVERFGFGDQAKVDVRRALVQVRARLRDETSDGGPTAETVKAEKGDDTSPQSSQRS